MRGEDLVLLVVDAALPLVGGGGAATQLETYFDAFWQDHCLVIWYELHGAHSCRTTVCNSLLRSELLLLTEPLSGWFDCLLRHVQLRILLLADCLACFQHSTIQGGEDNYVTVV